MPQDEQAAAEENTHDGRQLRDRRRIQAPERYGVPIAYLADVQDMTFDDVVSSDHADQWKSAMNEEMQALQENNTWTESYKSIFTTTMNTNHMKIHFTSQTYIEFILFPIIYEYLTWSQNGAFTLKKLDFFCARFLQKVKRLIFFFGN